MKGCAVEVALAGQEDKAVDRDRRLIRVKLDGELAAFGHLDRGGVPPPPRRKLNALPPGGDVLHAGNLPLDFEGEARI